MKKDTTIVIPTIRNLDFLEDWRSELEDYPIVIVQDGDPERKLDIPEGFNHQIYNWNDIDEELGKDSWIISRKDSACRCFGFLKSKTKYVYTLDDDCFPTKDVLKQHLQNLKSKSHPYYFNTLYDQQFVRGYPFGLRTGIDTAISHGLWLNIPDFDAPTQMVNPNFRNVNEVDAVVTIPNKTLYSMCGMNVAFDRELIGSAMYFGLMGEGYPIGRYDDMWAGWCSKIICDHLGYGVKTGKPYIWHDKASDWKNNFKKEYNGILWQEQLIPFFQNFKFSESSTNAGECYLEIATKVEKDLSNIDNYFEKVGNAMRTWTKVWRQNEESNTY